MSINPKSLSKSFTVNMYIVMCVNKLFTIQVSSDKGFKEYKLAHCFYGNYCHFLLLIILIYLGYSLLKDINTILTLIFFLQ